MTHIGLVRGKALVVPYNDAWPRLFVEEKRRLQAALAPYVGDIEHIGSTAVPGLAAKPLIDIMVAVDSLGVHKKFIAPLQKLGYEFMPERVFADRVFFPKGLHSNRTHHVNLVLKDSEQWRHALLFRDYLRIHDDARKEYEALKLKLAGEFGADRTRYTAAKNDFIQDVLIGR